MRKLKHIFFSKYMYRMSQKYCLISIICPLYMDKNSLSFSTLFFKDPGQNPIFHTRCSPTYIEICVAEPKLEPELELELELEPELELELELVPLV